MARSPRSLLPRSSSPRTARLLALTAVAAIALVIAGCIRTEVDIEVNDDGSGTLRFLAAVDRTVFDFAEQFDEDFDDGDLNGDLNGDADISPEDLMEDIDEDALPPGSSVEPYEDDDLIGVRVSVPFDDPDEIVPALAQLFGDEGAALSDDQPFDQFELEQDGDTWRFDARVELEDDELVDPSELEMARAMFGDADFIIRLSLPGEIADHNADELTDDGTLIWTLDFFDPTTRELHATSEGSDGGALAFLEVGDLDGAWVLAIGGAVIVLLVALAAWLGMRASRSP